MSIPTDRAETLAGGVRREWLSGANFVMLHFDLVDALGGSWEAAGLLSRIAFRAGADGWWTATVQELREDCRLSERKVRRAIQELRDAGMIVSERVEPFKPLLRWRLAYAGEPGAEGRNVPSVTDETSVIETDETSVSPSSKNRKNKTHTAPPVGGQVVLALVASGDVEEPALFASDEVAKPETGPPPKTAQTLVARWVDGHRSVGEPDPAGPYMARVAGQCRSLARSCKSDADWSAAWAATYAAGAAGRADPVPFMVQARSRYPQRTSNVYVAMAEQAAHMGLLDQMILGSPARPAIGGPR